jgi:hypothetical protein
VGALPLIAASSGAASSGSGPPPAKPHGGLPAAAGSASSLLGRLLDRPAAAARVVAALPTAVHVGTGAEEMPLISVQLPRAVALPCSLVVDALPDVRPGDPAVVGDGGLQLGGVWLRPARWAAPPRPRLSHPHRAAIAAADLPTSSWEELGLPADLELDLRAPTSVLGLGPGLTPAADDVLAGALVAWRASGDPRAAKLAAALPAQLLSGRTTALSAALLTHAKDGYCCPQLAAVLAALDCSRDPAAALRRLSGVGHTTGPALLAGAKLALTAQLRRRGR